MLNKYKTAFLAMGLFIGSTVQGQINEGGKPISFTKFYKQQQLIPVVQMPAFDIDAQLAEDAINDGLKKPYRFGFNHFVNLNIYNSGLWTTLPNGDKLWQIGIKSANALTINLTFNQFNLPAGAKLYLYNADKTQVLGAFTQKNNQPDGEFGADLINGSEIYVEYLEPAAVAGQGNFTIYRVTHGYRDVGTYLQRAFGDAGSCQINVNCALGIGWENEIKSVACIVSGGSEICTGALVNNTANDGTPYFLTANHCLGGSVSAWVFRFNWQASGCPNPGSSPTSNSISGATLRANSAATDMALLELSSTPPASYGVYYSGWNRGTTPATSVMGIHHPSGDIKKISEAANPVNTSTYGGASCWQIGTWTQGCTEPGSSGSPLFDQDHRIIGQLYGGPSYCGAPTSSMEDFYGRFDLSWTGGGTSSTRLSNWLDPLGTGPTTLDGYDPNGTPAAFADDAGVASITSPATGSSTCATSAEVNFVLRNYGSNALTSATINYQLDGGTVMTQSWTGSLASLATETISLPTLTGLSVGAHSLVIYTSNPNGVTDPNTVNDQQTATFTITAPSPTGTVPVSNAFATFPGTGFTIGNPDASVTWIQNTSVGGFGTSTTCAAIDNFTSDFAGQSDFIHTAYLDFSTLTGTTLLKFDVAYAPYDATYVDQLDVSVSSNCDTPVVIYSKAYTTLATSPAVTSAAFVPTAGQWRTETIDVSAYNGQTNVRFSFENISGYGQVLYLDNVNLTTTTGIIPLTFDNDIILMPNPASTNVSIDLPKTNANYTLRLMNALGQTISTEIVNGSTGKTSLSIESLQSGIYYISIESNGQKAVKKFVKE